MSVLNKTVEKSFLSIKQLCQDNNCKMIVVVPPVICDLALADGRYIAAMRAMEIFCDEQNLPYLNFTYAQGKSIPDLTGYFYNSGNHLDAEGIKIFNAGFASTISKLLNGQDVSSDFYTEEEWRKSIRVITDVWMTRKKEKGKLIYTAYVNCGQDVCPEYEFVLANGHTETVLQSYSEKDSITLEAAELNGDIKVYVRNTTDLSQEPQSYTF